MLRPRSRGVLHANWGGTPVLSRKTSSGTRNIIYINDLTHLSQRPTLGDRDSGTSDMGPLELLRCIIGRH
jgi:hypothetical protein